MHLFAQKQNVNILRKKPKKAALKIGDIKL